MNILALSCLSHDSSACLISDKRLICIEEERLNRKKQTEDFPSLAIQSSLRLAGISAEDLDNVVIITSYKQRARRFLYSILHSGENSTPLKLDINDNVRLFDRIKQTKILIKDNTKCKLSFIEHHLAHASSAYFMSPFKNSSILTVDGIGDWTTGLMAMGQGNTITTLRELKFPNSLGKFFGAICRYLGFWGFAKDGTVMALAALGDSKYWEPFRELYNLKSHGDIRINTDYFNFGWTQGDHSLVSEKFILKFGPARRPGDELQERHAQIASALQNSFEDMYFHLLTNLYQSTKLDKVSIAGGVGLNSVANGQILHKTQFKDVFVQPAANDAGLSIGGALLKYVEITKKRFDVENVAYLGLEFSDDEVEEHLKDCTQIRYTRLKNIAGLAAEFLAKGLIVGWFQGAMEIGPRALGSRSILADPRKSDVKKKLNEVIKKREEFRPFAATILDDKVSEVFHGPIPTAAHYMLTVHEIPVRLRNVIPAVCHIDGTCRIQVLARSENAVYYDLINEFYKLTNLPLVLNTSFNRKDEPIVSRPSEALDCYIKTNIDKLFIGSFLVEKLT